MFHDAEGKLNVRTLDSVTLQRFLFKHERMLGHWHVFLVGVCEVHWRSHSSWITGEIVEGGQITAREDMRLFRNLGLEENLTTTEHWWVTDMC